MRIRQLHINRFGHFEECDLAFSGDGLQVIFGPNEAGKTTLLEFLRGLLFDFPMRTPYDFGGQGEMAGMATIEMRDGRSVQLRRRKGNKDKVSIRIDGRPAELDGAGWLRMLDHADRGLFESVFAFGLDQLSQGEASLKHESLQSALFGGSLGGISSPDKIITDLTSQADSLFKKGGSKPTMNSLLNELRKLSKEIRERSLRPEKYHEAEVAAAKAAEQARLLHSQVDQLRRAHSKIEKQVRACPKWWDLQRLKPERAALTIPADVSAETRQYFQTVTSELKSLAQQTDRSRMEIALAEQGLAQLISDPITISLQAEIKACLELRQSFVEARQQLPERIRQRDALQRQIHRELTELRPGWTDKDLQRFKVDAAARAAIERLSDGRRERVTLLTRLNARRDDDVARLARAHAELAELGAPRDVTAIAAVLKDEADFVSNQKQLQTVRGSLLKLDRKLATQFRKLTPPLTATITAPHEIPVPRWETVVEFEARFSELREQLKSARASVAEAAEEQFRISALLAAETSANAVPGLDDLKAARARRDLGWNLMRQQYISGDQPGFAEHQEADVRHNSTIADWLGEVGAASLPDAYEQTVRFADGIADQIYRHADVVARRENLQRQQTELVERFEHKQQRLLQLERQQAELQSNWVALWAPCGFQPLAVDAMLAWHRDHDAVCTTMVQRDELHDELSQLSQRIATFEKRLRDACGEVADDVAALLIAAGKSVDEVREQSGRRLALQIEIRTLDQQIVRHDEQLRQLAADETAAMAEWQQVLKQLDLPSDWSADLVREVIDKLQATRVRLDSLPEEESRIAAMQARVQEFEERVHALCDAVQPQLLQDPIELAIVKLGEQLEHALEAQRRSDELERKLTESRRQLALLTEHYQRQQSEQSRLFAVASVTTEDAFLEVVAQVEKALRLDREIEQLERELDLIRAGDDREEFEQSLSSSELALLQRQERDLREELEAVEQSRRLADGAEAVAHDALSRLDGSSVVAVLSEEQARKRSLLATEVDRYMPLVYARHLLNSAVHRFEKENQPEMIATVSRLLNEMTGGKYVEFDRMGSGKQQNLLIRRFDGVERTPDQLSTGTREQLYLAIRIAYVLHYCGQNEPLPIVIDDVLVNFDGQRARQTLKTLAGVSDSAQVLFFTCHTHIVEMACEMALGMTPIDLRSIRA